MAPRLRQFYISSLIPSLAALLSSTLASPYPTKLSTWRSSSRVERWCKSMLGVARLERELAESRLHVQMLELDVDGYRQQGKALQDAIKEYDQAIAMLTLKFAKSKDAHRKDVARLTGDVSSMQIERADIEAKLGTLQADKSHLHQTLLVQEASHTRAHEDLISETNVALVQQQHLHDRFMHVFRHEHQSALTQIREQHRQQMMLRERAHERTIARAESYWAEKLERSGDVWEEGAKEMERCGKEWAGDVCVTWELWADDLEMETDIDRFGLELGVVEAVEDLRERVHDLENENADLKLKLSQTSASHAHTLATLTAHLATTAEVTSILESRLEEQQNSFQLEHAQLESRHVDVLESLQFAQIEAKFAKEMVEKQRDSERRKVGKLEKEISRMRKELEMKVKLAKAGMEFSLGDVSETEFTLESKGAIRPRPRRNRTDRTGLELELDALRAEKRVSMSSEEILEGLISQREEEIEAQRNAYAELEREYHTVCDLLDQRELELSELYAQAPLTAPQYESLLAQKQDELDAQQEALTDLNTNYSFKCDELQEAQRELADVQKQMDSVRKDIIYLRRQLQWIGVDLSNSMVLVDDPEELTVVQTPSRSVGERSGSSSSIGSSGRRMSSVSPFRAGSREWPATPGLTIDDSSAHSGSPSISPMIYTPPLPLPALPALSCESEAEDEGDVLCSPKSEVYERSGGVLTPPPAVSF